MKCRLKGVISVICYCECEACDGSVVPASLGVGSQFVCVGDVNMEQELEGE